MAEKIDQRPQKSQSRLKRAGARIGATLTLATAVRPSPDAIQAALDEEARNKIVASEMDQATGTITHVKDDGGRHVVPRDPELARQVAGFNAQQQTLELERSFHGPSANDPHIKDNQ